MHLIAFAIPGFFILIGIEVLVARIRGRNVYRFSDSIADLSCGVSQQVVAAFIAVMSVAGYKYIQNRFGLFEIESSTWWAWVVCFLGVDFCYYWFHRMSHEVAFLWGAHVVHHQSEEYNLTVALRQSAFQPGFSWLFYLPLALIGFPPLMFFVLASLNTLYQFWIHTRLVGRVGPLEWIINTPSHHRVHHGRNAQYIDRNHAGTLIIWDRLFGTFEPEDEEVVYGVNDVLDSYNPVWANFHYYVKTWRRARSFPRMLDRVRVWFSRPGWTPEGGVPPTGRALDQPKYDPIPDRRVVYYVLAQFALVVGATVAYLFVDPAQFGWATKIAFGLFIITSVAMFNGLLESKRWAQTAEGIRPLVFAVGLFVFLPPSQRDLVAAIPAGLFVLASGAAMLALRSPARDRAITA